MEYGWNLLFLVWFGLKRVLVSKIGCLHGYIVKDDSRKDRKQEVNGDIKEKLLQQIALYNLFWVFPPDYWFTLPLTFRFSSVCFFLWEENCVRHLINAYMEMFPICLQMHHACFLQGPGTSQRLNETEPAPFAGWAQSKEQKWTFLSADDSVTAHRALKRSPNIRCRLLSWGRTPSIKAKN